MDRCLAAWPMDRPDDARAPWHPSPLTLTPRIRLALPSRPIHDAALRDELVALADRQVTAARADASPLVDDLAALALVVVHQEAGADHPFAARLLTACSLHRAVVGRTGALYDTLVPLVARADRMTDPRARFRVCRLAFACELARGDLNKACEHAERAYRAALAEGGIACKYESLLLVVQLLEAMGLWRDARALALDLAAWRDDDATHGVLPVVNAIHGLRVCRRLDDVEAATRFDAQLRDRESGVAPVDAMTGAMIAAARTAHHAWIGKPRAASRAVERGLARPALDADPRALAITLLAQAELRIANEDAVGMRASASALAALLDRVGLHGAVRPPVLRMLVRLDIGASDARAAHDRLALLASARAPGVCGRDAPLPVDFLWWTASEHDHPAINADDACAEHQPAHAPSFAEIGFDFDDFVVRTGERCAAESEAALRTPHFDIVESWAIAAEIAAGGNGRQCFKVGRVGAALGAALGFSDERCAVLDMACRVRDLGRAAVDCLAGDDGMAVDDARVAAERARAADRMLSFSGDPVLVVAARIAKHRDAWWNGSAFATTERGERIPIEARICAVADALVELVDPLEDRRRRWSIERALQQIDCLAGVRFDPTLVRLLSRVLRHERSDVIDMAERRRPMSADDSLAKAKKHLFETLELVD